MKILVCNGAHIGDVILSTSVLPILKKHFPASEIGFLCGSWSKIVVHHHQFIDHLHIYDQSPLNRDPISKKMKRVRAKQTWQKALKEVREIQYDLALDLYSYYHKHSGRFLYHAKIPRRVAYFASVCPYFYTDLLCWDWHRYPIVENHQMMLHKLGIPSKSGKPILSYKNIQLSPRIHHLLPPKYLLIHTGTGEIRREWPLKSWKTLVEMLQESLYPLVFIGKGKREQELISTLCEIAPSSINLCDQLSWHELLYTIKKAHLLIGLESMAGHVAACFNVPSILLYGHRESFNKWKPYNPICEVVAPYQHFQDEHAAILTPYMMDKITPEEVFLAIQEKLKTA